MSEPFQHSNYTCKGKIEITNIVEDGKYILGSDDMYDFIYTTSTLPKKCFELRLQLTEEGIRIIKNDIKEE